MAVFPIFNQTETQSFPRALQSEISLVRGLFAFRLRRKSCRGTQTSGENETFSPPTCTPIFFSYVNEIRLTMTQVYYAFSFLMLCCEFE